MFLYHIIVFTVPGIIRYPCQLIDVNSTSMFVTICIGGVAKGVKQCRSLSYSVLDTVRYFVWVYF